MIVSVVLTAVAIGLGTYGFGWLAVPVIGLVVGFAGISKHPVLTAAIAALLAWGDLLALGALGGPVVELAGLLGGVMGLPGPAVLALTIVYPAVLAGAAAGTGGGIRTLLSGEAAVRERGA